jgi:hypothetical protein
MVVSCPRFPDSADTTQKKKTPPPDCVHPPAHPPPKLPSRSVCQECTYHVICRDLAPPEGVQQGAPAYLIVKLWITCSALWRRGPLGFHSITNICGAQVECIERTEKRRKLAAARVEIEKQSGSGWCPHYLSGKRGGHETTMASWAPTTSRCLQFYPTPKSNFFYPPALRLALCYGKCCKQATALYLE